MMKIGIGVPCYKEDVDIAERYVLPSISRLNPQPHKVFIYVNDCGLKKARTHIFDKLLIEGDCDVALQACTDYYFFPKILRHVDPNNVVTFCAMTTTPIVSMSMMVGRNLSKKPWTGCYSIPRQVWKRVRENQKWDGTDSSVQKSLGGNFKYTRFPNYMLRRVNSGHVLSAVSLPDWRNRRFHQRALKMIQALKI